MLHNNYVNHLIMAMYDVLWKVYFYSSLFLFHIFKSNTIKGIGLSRFSPVPLISGTGENLDNPIPLVLDLVTPLQMFTP